MKCKVSSIRPLKVILVRARCDRPALTRNPDSDAFAALVTIADRWPTGGLHAHALTSRLISVADDPNDLVEHAEAIRDNDLHTPQGPRDEVRPKKRQ
jgi:hypothetical protein